jgi:2-aminoadipate transaminase
MSTRPEQLYSAQVSGGPPLFFPDPDVPAVFNFDQGLAAPETFPREDLVRIARLVLERDGPAVLDYFDPAAGYEELVYGYRGLRQRLADRIKVQQGRDLGAAGVILTSGSVQAIALAAAGFVDRGDVVAVEAASFPYALRYFETAGAELKPIPIDQDGLDTDALEAVLLELQRAGRRLKLVYTVPTFHCPTGAEMSVARRRKLVQLAQRFGFLIIEDDVYADLRFAGEPKPSMLGMDDSGLVIQCGSFSKIIAPGLRLGWMAGDPKAIAALAAVRQDLGVSQWMARVMAEYLDQGLLEPHLAKVNKVYAAKARTAVEAARAHCGDFVRFAEPTGSFYLWIEIDGRVDWERAAALAAKEGIFFRPGERFMGDTGGRQFVRLAYSHVDEAVIADGIKRLGAILHECQR